MNGAGFEVNVGVRAGFFSYPFFLPEGLATLWRGSFEGLTVSRNFLTGTANEIQAPLLKVPLTLQLGERRGALIVAGTWESYRLCFVNLHIHHGPPDAEGSNRRPNRRSEELKKALEVIQRDFADSDAVFMLGDFNSERVHSEIQMLLNAGFEELSLENGQPVPTWDPISNPLCRQNARITHGPAKAWDSERHQFDHIFVRARPGAFPTWRVRFQRVFDNDNFGMFISDHYGLLVDLVWEETDHDKLSR
jgi:endonuclease/exonuclease/phosphatase family metal-dependent hydrolase